MPPDRNCLAEMERVVLSQAVSWRALLLASELPSSNFNGMDPAYIASSVTPIPRWFKPIRRK
ncbi:MAG: hypothetical protein ABIV50_16565 [Opitutus sp.]